MSRSSLLVARTSPGVNPGWSPLRRLTVAALSAAALILPMVAVTAVPAVADTAPVAPASVSTVSADALPTVQINGVAWDQVVVGDTVYVTGEFTSARPAGAAAGTNEVSRSNLLAYKLSTGALISSWAPTLNAKGAVIAASADGSRIFVGGSFTSVSGVARYRVVALDATTGAVVPTWNVVVNTRVRSLAVSGNTLYIGGIFTTVGGQARTRLAAVNATTGALLPWAPSADAEVMALTVSGGNVVAGGKFTTLNGADGYGMGALDPVTGASKPWAIGATVRNAGDDAAIYSLSSDGTQVYGTGYTFGGGGNFEGTFAARASDGAMEYVTGCRGDTYDATPIGGVLYNVGHPHDCSTIGGIPQTDPWTYQRATAQTIAKAPSGRLNAGGNFNGQPAPELLHWTPDMMAGTFTGSGQAAWTVEGNSNYVVLGGEFPRVNNTPQQGLVRFAVTSIAPNAQGPQNAGDMTPTLRSLSAGRLRISWKSSWDRDNRQLTYDVLRGSSAASAVSIATVTGDSIWYARPQMFVNDPSAPAGSTQTYRIRVRDAFGNTSTGPAATITVPTGGTSSVYADRVLADGATHLWRLGESGGTAAYDYVAADDLTLDASATRNTDGAMVNDGTAKSTTFPGTAAVPGVTPSAVPGPQSFSEEAWFKTTSTSGGKILGFGNSNNGNSGGYDRHIYMTNAGKIVFGVYPGGVQTLTTPASYNDGQWHQVVTNLGSTGTELFVDGKRIARNPGVTSAQEYSGYWRIGGDNLGGWPDQPSSFAFAGAIEDVAIYPAPQSLTQVQAHYQASGRSLNLPSRPTDAYGAAVWDAGATLYWRLDDAVTSTTAADRITNNPASGNYSAGIVKGQAGAPANASGTSIRFPSGSDQTLVAAEPTDNPTTYSLETWFKTTTTHGGRLFGFGNAASGYSSSYDRHIYMLNDGRLRYGIWTGNTETIDSPQPLNDGQWHQVVATQGSNGEQLFVDGVRVATGTATTPQGYSGYWRLGADNAWGGYDTNEFDGSFDEAAVYDTVLAAATVAQHYQLGAPPAANQPPTAAFSSSKVNLKASFDASASADADGTIASYSWQFGDGTTGTGKTPDHTYTAAGSYDVVLTVTDDKGASATVTHPVSVTQAPNVAPTAAFTVTKAKLKATFDGTGSADSDGTIASYAWDFGDGSTGTGATPVHTYAATGSYTAVLTVTDNRGASATAGQTVAVTGNAAPTAAFTSTCTNLACHFDAAAAADSDGTIAGYSWNFGDGTAAGTGKTPDHTYAAAGTRNVTLTVTDDDGATDAITQPVTVAAANNSPTAALTSSGTGLTRSFSGSGSADSDGTIASYSWNFGDGSAAGTGVSPSHTYTAAGSYTVVLTVTDNQGATGTASITIAVTAPNQAPVARFSSTCTELDCSFTAAASTDADGSVVGYAWTFGDGTTGTGVTPAHHYAAGTYSVTLTVTDDDGGTDSVTHSVSPALTPNQAPTAAFTSACTNLACGFDASTSSDADGSVVGYAWTFGDGTTGTGVTPAHTYAVAGTYSVALTVTDDDGATKTVSKSVTVTAPAANQAPTAAMTVSCTDLACGFDASGSTDPDGTVTGYAWSFGDGGSATGKTAMHTFAAAGSYSVVLTVTDNQGATNSLTRAVTVTTGPVTLASDAFNRTVASGFGTADTGGAWTYAAAGSTGSVTGGAARISVPVSRTATLTLGGVANLSNDVTNTVWADAMPTGGGVYLGTLARIAGAGEYSARVKILSTGVVNLGLTRAGTAIGSQLNVPGLTYTAGTKLQVRVQAVGSSPTTVRAKVWVAGATEPANWMVTATDSTAGFQVPGAVGLSPYVSGSATAALVLHYDDFVATSVN